MQYQIEKLSEDVFNAFETFARDNPEVLLAMGGGSTTDAMSGFWPLLNQSEFNSRLVLTLTDERVSSEFSNFTRLENLLEPFPQLNFKRIPWLVNAEIREVEVEAAFHISPRILLFGIGEDGHVVGVLPHKAEFSENFLKGEVIEYSVSESSASAMQIAGVDRRASIDLQMLKTQIEQSDFAAVVWKGESKRGVHEKIIGSENYPANEFPAIILREFIHSGKLKVYCDYN